MFCNNCGNQLSDDAKFCNKCGASQNTSAPDTSSDANRNPVPAGQSNAPKHKSGLFAGVLKLAAAIALIWLLVKAVLWIFPNLEDKLSGKNSYKDAGTDFSFAAKSESQEAIAINNISFDDSLNSITYEFENISDKDIAYVVFETYFYDRMGGALSTDYLGEGYSLNLKYTGPLYAGDTDSCYWDYVFSMPEGTSVVYPKKITVTFVDDEEITFENTLYCHSDDFYGGELKDNK